MYMAVRLYELKRSEKVKASAYTQNVFFDDMADIGPELLQRIKFVIGNGMVVSRFGDTFGPRDNITRGELMALIERVLVLCGEL